MVDEGTTTLPCARLAQSADYFGRDTFISGTESKERGRIFGPGRFLLIAVCVERFRVGRTARSSNTTSVLPPQALEMHPVGKTFTKRVDRGAHGRLCDRIVIMHNRSAILPLSLASLYGDLSDLLTVCRICAQQAATPVVSPWSGGTGAELFVWQPRDHCKPSVCSGAGALSSPGRRLCVA